MSSSKSKRVSDVKQMALLPDSRTEKTVAGFSELCKTWRVFGGLAIDGWL